VEHVEHVEHVEQRVQLLSHPSPAAKPSAHWHRRPGTRPLARLIGRCRLQRYLSVAEAFGVEPQNLTNFAHE